MRRSVRDRHRHRRSRGGWLVRGFLALVLLALAAFFTIAATEADRRLNTVTEPSAPRVSDDARRVHQSLFIADLHSDLLLWSRDPLARHDYGHTDVPRLLEGNVALQVFSVVTKAPWGQNYERTATDRDQITLLAMAQRWPFRTWSSLKERALYQAARLNRAAEASGGYLSVIRTRGDLSRHLAARERDPSLLAGLLAMEGMHPLEGELANLDVFFDAGFRMLAPTHFFDNDVSGSAHGIEQGGLSELGRSAIRRMQAKGVVVDLAHASAKTIDDVLGISTHPVVVSHTGVRATCEGPRNLTDAQLRGIAATGGVVGIGFWPDAVCGSSIDAIAKAIRHAVDTIGAEHVALGSDFDGTTAVPFNASRLSRLTEGLLSAGFTPSELRLIMGENVLRVLRETLPE